MLGFQIEEDGRSEGKGRSHIPVYPVIRITSNWKRNWDNIAADTRRPGFEDGERAEERRQVKKGGVNCLAMSKVPTP